jgi:GDP-L-fucose synthase
MSIFIAGHNGMVGSAIARKINKPIISANRSDLNLENQNEVEAFFKEKKPETVILAAARVGGINANNKYRAEFIYSNLQIQNNVIHNSFKHGVKKLIFLGSSCIYPKFAEQPIKEESLLSGFLEFTNEPYAIAKIAGIKMCESYYRQYGCNFISVMPTNLYGPKDNFDLENAHVLPSLLRKFHEAKIANRNHVDVWGTGKAKREFLHVDDMAQACLFILEKINAKDLYENGISHLNIGSGFDLSISDLCLKIANIIKYNGELRFDNSKPDGTLRKLMDSSRLFEMGWKPSISLEDGLESTYNWYINNL